MIFRAFLLLMLLAANCAHARQEMRWNSDQVSVKSGEVTQADELLKIRAPSSGLIFVSVQAEKISLDEFSDVAIELVESPGSARFFIAWRAVGGNVEAHDLEPTAVGSAVIGASMRGENGWSGAIDQIGIGIRLIPGSIVSIRAVSLSRPTIFNEAKAYLNEWSSFKGWKPVDINLYTGTIFFREGIPPAPFFAGVLLAALTGYFIYLLLIAGLRRFNWRVAGMITLVCWIALDLLWQVRLGRQVKDTYNTFAGKSSTEKLLASVDAPVVRFVSKVRAAIQGNSPRIFLASASDRGGMLSAYYMAPLNTYWHRGGPELPERRYLATGDYILLVAPYVTRYNAARSIISLPDASSIAVESVLQEPEGVLLRIL